MSVIAIDFETANERRDSACAVGLAWIADGRVARRVSHLIRPPELRFSPGNIRVHGILPADVRGAPSAAEALAPYLPEMAGATLIAHNAGFDSGVLRASLAACGAPVPAFSFLCTLQIARRVFPDPAGHGLGKVAARLGIRFEHHDAGEDAYACAEIALAALRETGAPSLAAMARGLGLSPITLPPGDSRGEDRPRFAATGRPGPSPDALRFTIRGSTGNRYDVVLEERFGLYLRCSCQAGRNRRRCRHVDAVVDGDLTDLLSDNHSDLDRLRLRIEAAGGTIDPLRIRRIVAA